MAALQLAGGDEALPIYDCLIIGGGPSGLSAATVLARQHFSVVLFDSRSYRGDSSHEMHNVAGWNHHRPEEFRETTRRTLLERYPNVRIEYIEIQHARQSQDGHFEVSGAALPVWRGRKLILAMGVRDVFPDITGYEECWADGIINDLCFQSCDDAQSRSAGILAVGDVATVARCMILGQKTSRYAADVTIYADGNKRLYEKLRQHPLMSSIVVDSRAILRLEKGKLGKSLILHFADQTVKEKDILVHESKTELSGPFAQQLGLDLTAEGNIKISHPTYATSLPGVFAVGDCVNSSKAVVHATSTGAFGAEGVSAELATTKP